MGIYKNVMELLVEEEVVRQHDALPPRVAEYVNRIEWVAHALNQLPPLYATSEKGLNHQLERGRVKHGAEIKRAVQRALAAIRRDPLRTSTPLRSPQAPFAELLSQLRFLLRNDRLEWNTLTTAIEQALEQASQGKFVRRPAATLRSPSMYAPVRGASPFPSYPAAETKEDLARLAKPQSTTKPVTKPTKPAADNRNETFGWDDPLYNPR